MKPVYNCKDWITDELLSELLDPTVGELTPVTQDHYTDHQYLYWKSQGFNCDRIRFTFIFQDHLKQQLTLPTFFKNVKEFWFSRLMPGDIIPCHSDKFKYDVDKIKRYWMAMQDYTPGHVFIYENQIFANYKKGDVFLFESPESMHAAANIGFSPKLTLQVSCFEEL